jgi:hypothetical protein
VIEALEESGVLVDLKAQASTDATLQAVREYVQHTTDCHKKDPHTIHCEYFSTGRRVCNCSVVDAKCTCGLDTLLSSPVSHEEKKT